MLALPPQDDPRLLVGSATGDDAAVYRVSDGLALVQTIDFFTPLVDDPYDFGRIAAANALSDVYAMGGTPLTALNVVAFPLEALGPDVLREILRGGSDVVREAGALVVGGHSIKDDEPKYGLAVTGVVDPARITTNAGGRAGDVLVLTKPLGVGAIVTARKRGAADDALLARAVETMVALNADAAEAAARTGARAVTDVTGFGLLGHLHHLCRESGLAATVDAARRAGDRRRRGAPGRRARASPAAARRNAEWASGFTAIADDVPPGAGACSPMRRPRAGCSSRPTRTPPRRCPGRVSARSVEGPAGTICVLHDHTRWERPGAGAPNGLQSRRRRASRAGKVRLLRRSVSMHR